MTERSRDTAQRGTRDVRVDSAVDDVRERFGELVKTVRKTLAELQEATSSGGHEAHALRWFAQSDDADPELDTLAVELAIAAYNNRENAIWDPLDPRTCRGEADENSFLFQLLSKEPTPDESTDPHGCDAASDADARANHARHDALQNAPANNTPAAWPLATPSAEGAGEPAGTKSTDETPQAMFWMTV